MKDLRNRLAEFFKNDQTYKKLVVILFLSNLADAIVNALGFTFGPRFDIQGIELNPLMATLLYKSVWLFIGFKILWGYLMCYVIYRIHQHWHPQVELVNKVLVAGCCIYIFVVIAAILQLTLLLIRNNL